MRCIFLVAHSPVSSLVVVETGRDPSRCLIFPDLAPQLANVAVLGASIRLMVGNEVKFETKVRFLCIILMLLRESIQINRLSTNGDRRA